MSKLCTIGIYTIRIYLVTKILILTSHGFFYHRLVGLSSKANEFVRHINIDLDDRKQMIPPHNNILYFPWNSISLRESIPRQ